MYENINESRRYIIEEVFKDFGEYRTYLVKAFSLFQDMQKSRRPSLRAFVPEYLEISFESVKAPRLYFPRYKGTIVVQLPNANLNPKKKAVLRQRALIEFSSVVKLNEIAAGESFAMRMKIMEKSAKRLRRSRET